MVFSVTFAENDRLGKTGLAIYRVQPTLNASAKQYFPFWYPYIKSTKRLQIVVVARIYRNHDKVHWNHIKYNSVQEAMDAPDGLAVLGIIMVENTRRANFR